MGLIDDPFYRNMIEGDDTEILIGTLSVASPDGTRQETLPVFLIDYQKAPEGMEALAAETFDDLKKINLTVKDGVYMIAADDQTTALIFSGEETAAHTAPNFWAEYTPKPEEHEAFQREYVRLGIWVLMILTKEKLREFVVGPRGTILFKKIVPMTDELRKRLRVE